MGRIGVATYVVAFLAATGPQQGPVQHGRFGKADRRGLGRCGRSRRRSGSSSACTVLPCQPSTRAEACRKLVSVATTRTDNRNWSPWGRPGQKLFLGLGQASARPRAPGRPKRFRRGPGRGARPPATVAAVSTTGAGAFGRLPEPGPVAAPTPASRPRATRVGVFIEEVAGFRSKLPLKPGSTRTSVPLMSVCRPPFRSRFSPATSTTRPRATSCSPRSTTCAAAAAAAAVAATVPGIFGPNQPLRAHPTGNKRAGFGECQTFADICGPFPCFV